MFQKVDYIYQKNIRDMVFLVGSFGLAYVRIGHQAVYMLQALKQHPSLKELREEYYSFKGVPPNSVVRKYPNDYLKHE